MKRYEQGSVGMRPDPEGSWCEYSEAETLRALLKECKKVMQANSVFRGTLEHKDLSRRISIALKGLTKVKR